MTASWAKPIMVSFGTNQGSITPLYKTTPAPPKTIVQRSPAPTYEATDDIPNPNTYRPPIPHQYRSKIHSFRPNTNLILGTPIDRKYTPYLNKYDVHRQDVPTKAVGREYTGPQYFEIQPYEYFDNKRVRTPIQNVQQFISPQSQQQRRYVPEIGVVYSSGVRYYVPQLYYSQDGEEENSVYDKNDVKRVY